MRLPPPGRLIDIGGRRLHLYEQGRGSPVVVFESGIAATSLNWRALQAEIAKFARAVSYDRAGLGWSDSAAPLTLAQFTADLHAILTAARLPPPYILVAHSFGGLIVRAFARLYPAEVKGLVLVDAVRPELWYPLSREQGRTLSRAIRLSRRGAALARIGLVGWCLRSLLAGSRRLPKAIGGAASGRGLAVMRRIGGEVAKMPRETWPLIAALWSEPKSFLAMAAHFEALPEAARETLAAPPLEGIPIIALTPQGAALPLGPGADVRHVVARKSGHWIHLYEPELVIDAVQRLISGIP